MKYFVIDVNCCIPTNLDFQARRYSTDALAEAHVKGKALREEAERAAFAAALAEWRRSSGPVTIVREEGVVTRPAGSWAEATEQSPPP